MTTDDQTNVWGSGRFARNSLASSRSDIVWLGDIPVAQIDAGTTTRYTFTDHLGTPIIQTDDIGLMIWRAEYEPFGDLWMLRAGNSRYDQPLRFPGQEVSMTWEGHEENYNIFRWYRSGWGRYTQPDPNPLMHGDDIYGYVKGSPVMHFDPYGLYRVVDNTAANAIGTLNSSRYCNSSLIACTVGLGASLGFNCIGCGNQWRPAEVVLAVHGQIYAYNGAYGHLPVQPLDKTVVNFASAVVHEHAWHIDIALAAVHQIITKYEGQTFSSQLECEDNGEWANDDVQRTFSYVYGETQRIEKRGGDPRRVPF